MLDISHTQVRDLFSFGFDFGVWVFFSSESELSRSSKRLLLLFSSPDTGMLEGTACSSNPVEFHGTAGDWAVTGSHGSIKLCKMLQSEKILKRTNTQPVF